MRIFTIVVGALLVIAGIWCFSYPALTFLSVAFILGFVMIISGINGIVDYLASRRISEISGWRLAEGIISIILGVVVLNNLLVTDAVILLFFALWIVFMGVLRIAASLALQKQGVSGWGVVLGLGILSVAVGLVAIVAPALAGITLVIFIGSFFIVQGVNVLVSGLQAKQLRK